MSHHAEIEFFAPPGTYTLEAYGTQTQNVRKTITIEPGQRELTLEPIDLPPSGLVLLEGKSAPELHDIVAWKNGGPLKLADLHGKVVIVIFMPDEAMWDETLTSLLTAYKKFHQQGLIMIEVRINHRGMLDSQAKMDEHLASIKTRLFLREAKCPFRSRWWFLPIHVLSSRTSNRKSPASLCRTTGYRVCQRRF